MQLCILGRPVPAERTLKLGATNQITEQGQSFAQANEIAQALAKAPRGSQRMTKEMASSAYEADEADQLDFERDAVPRA